MGEREDIETLQILMVGITGMFVMALAIILFFVIYQRRLLKMQSQQQTLEISFQKELLKASLRSQEIERQRIGRNLHDDLGALLSTSKLYVGQIIDKYADKPELHAAQQVEQLHEQMIKTVRNISKDLRPVVLENFGLLAAIENLKKSIEESTEINISFQHPDNICLSKEVELELYRIIQELLTNTIRHAQAEKVTIVFASLETLFSLKYSDDGIGIEPIQTSSGLGLKNITSRINLLAGQIIYPKGKGFQVQFLIPINHENQY